MEFTFEARLGDRELFPELEPLVYLNHAAISPPSLAVRWAMKRVVADYERRGVGAFTAWHEQRGRLRGKIAELIGAAAPSDVAFVPSTTRGIVDVALCLPWSRGDRVVLFEGEFPANITPWQRAAALFGLEIAMIPLALFADADAPGLARLDEELARGARLVAVSAVEFQTGLRMPLAAIGERCRAHGAELFVDAVQACGVGPIDVRAAGIDYLACGSHKWLMGLEGAGFLYASPERAAALRPSVAGWLSHDDGLGFLFEGPGLLRYDRPLRRTIDFVECGNYNTAGLAALEASVDLLLGLGVRAIFDHVGAYHDALEPGLRERGFTSLRAIDPARRSGILGVLPPDGVGVVALQRALGARGISCSIPDGVLRLSPHWPNALDEVEQVLATLDLALADARG